MLVRSIETRNPITNLLQKEIRIGYYKNKIYKFEYNIHNRTGKPLNCFVSVYNPKPETTHNKIYTAYYEYDKNGRRVFKAEV